MKEEKNYSVPNLERALVLLELLKEFKHGLTLAELQEKSNFPKSSLFRITQTLLEQGYLIRSKRPSRFALSKKLLHIGLSTLSESSLVEDCLPMMRILRDDLQETVLLGALIEKEGVLLEQVLGLHPFVFMLRAGTRFNLHASTLGKSIVAFLPEKEQQDTIEAISFEKFNQNTIINKADYCKELQWVREKGYGTDCAEELEGVHCIGAPIFNQYGYPIAALWITAPSVRLPQSSFEKTGKIIKAACLSISRQYGYRKNKTKDLNL